MKFFIEIKVNSSIEPFGNKIHFLLETSAYKKGLLIKVVRTQQLDFEYIEKICNNNNKMH